VITAVENGGVDLGIVPSNSIEGSIPSPRHPRLRHRALVQQEVDLPVSLHPVPLPADVRHHHRGLPPNPLGQTRMWMAKHLPDATAVAATPPPGRPPGEVVKKGMASIGTREGGQGLEILASEIATTRNQTRFVIVGYGIPAPTEHDLTSIRCFNARIAPAPYSPSSGVRGRAIGITKLGRAPPNDLGEYCFCIDFGGCLGDGATSPVTSATWHEAAGGGVPRLLSVAGDEGHVRRKAAPRGAAWARRPRDQIRGGDTPDRRAPG
jgi:prephenate dehydratase